LNKENQTYIIQDKQQEFYRVTDQRNDKINQKELNIFNQTILKLAIIKSKWKKPKLKPLLPEDQEFEWLISKERVKNETFIMKKFYSIH
jgi:hypothetical protein